MAWLQSVKPELILGIWGAVLSTILTVHTLVKAMRDKSQVIVSARFVDTKLAPDADSHGCPFVDPNGLRQEREVELVIVNHGAQPCQITTILIDHPGCSVTIEPSMLPAGLGPRSQLLLRIQPEWLLFPEGDEGKQTEVKFGAGANLFGVVDGVGRLHRVQPQNLANVIVGCRNLPLRWDIDPSDGKPRMRAKDDGRVFSKETRPVPDRSR